MLGDRQFADKWGDPRARSTASNGGAGRRVDGREIDQIEQVIDQIRKNPTSRRMIWEEWNVGELDQMALPPCHKTYQVFVSGDGKLSLAMSSTQR